jgi:DNA-binding transcriptional LysR family regulator
MRGWCLQQMERMHGEIDDYAGGMAGKVRLLSNTAAITDYLPQALADFLNSHPAIDVELEERPSHVIVSQLLTRRRPRHRGGLADISSSNPGPSGATGWCW